LAARLDRLARTVRRPHWWLRELAVIHQYRAQLAKARNDPNYTHLFDSDRTPLVTVRIATWNRGQVLCERTLPTVLAQSYPRVEVLVVGDHCTDDTAERIRAIGDPRIRFVNLPERGKYPDEPFARWMVAGAAPMNYALGEAKGEWLAPLDDDDEFTPDHIESMLEACRRERAEMAFGIARMRLKTGEWRDVGSLPLRRDHVCHSAVFYWTGLRFMPHDVTAWKLGEPGDWNLWRRMKWSGVRIAHVPHLVAIHHLERSQWGA
jgi:glycosyltransferase involved in cell wall biosynthesis